MLLHQRANHTTMNNNRRKLICVSHPLSKISFARATQNIFLQSIIYPSDKKNSLEQAAFWLEVKVVCCLSTLLFTPASSSCETAAKKIRNIPCSLLMTRAMTAQWEKESYWMHLIDLEGDTNFTVQNQSAVKGQMLGLCLPPRLALLAWGNFHVCSRFARSTIPKEK